MAIRSPARIATALVHLALTCSVMVRRAGPPDARLQQGGSAVPTKREQFMYSVRARYLGERMRGLREERGQTLKYIAAYLGVEFSTLARYERAEWPFRVDHVIALLDVYGVFEERQREELVALARNAWRVCAWEVAGVKDAVTAGANEQPIIDQWWIQSKAEELCVYAPVLPPPLLQARDYAETLIRFRDPQMPMMKVEAKVRELIDRQQVLDDRPPIRLTVILEEAALSRRAAGPAVTLAQWEHLVRAVERPHVNVLVLPTNATLHHGIDGGFTLCRMHPPYPPVALLDQLTGRAAIEADAAEQYSVAFDKLKEAALNPTHSIGLIQQEINDLGTQRPTSTGREGVAA
ncbi:helix-turn-helix transcriptional regulator [Phytohabitans flavus]|uniref:helix-turn-helix domain-containing protein n=1 Tax=Phytohabitans flavus TaxID=1076124 RepID=UPI0031EB1D31